MIRWTSSRYCAIIKVDQTISENPCVIKMHCRSAAGLFRGHHNIVGGNAMKRKALTRTASILLAGMMTVGAAALPVMNSPAVVGVYADASTTAVKTVWKTGMNALAGVFPFVKLFEPLSDLMFNSTMDALRNINENINQLRDELNERIDELENRVDHNTKQVLNKIKNQTFINGMGTELDKLHTSVEGIARQITVIQKDSSMSEEEKAVEIAAQIGSNTEWNRDGSLVFRIKTLGNVLAGKSFADTDGRDFYQVVFDNAAGDVMFSGEAYDAAAPYIDRVMYEYMLAYTVLADCFKEADTVSKLTDEQIDALPAKVRNTYFNTVSQTSLVENEFDTITDRIFNGNDRDSVSSRFCQFRYKKDNDRNVFVNKGTVHIPIAKQAVKCGAAKGFSNDYDQHESLYWSSQDEVQNYLNSSAINPNDINAMLSYYKSKYPGTAFTAFLKKANIDVPVGADSYFPTQGKVLVKTTYGRYRRDEHIGFKGFDPFSSAPSEVEAFLYFWLRAGLSTRFSFTPQNAKMLIFKKAEQEDFPETAEEILAKEPEYGISVNIAPKKEQNEIVVGGGAVFPDDLFKVTVTDHNGNNVSNAGYSWDIMELPRNGVTMDYNGRLYFTKSGIFHIRAVYTAASGKTVYSNWTSLYVHYNGASDDEFDIDETVFPDPQPVEADENTVFVIRNSYTGLVGAEPDRIEKPSEPEPVYRSEIPEEYPAHQRLMVNAYDGTGKEINVPYIWESEGADGIALSDDGTVSFTEEGSYKIRVRSGEYVSEWFWVEAVTESEEYATVSFFDDDGKLIKNVIQPWGTELEAPDVPEREGYTFAGWSPALPQKVPADDLSLTAVWVKAQEPAGENSSSGDNSEAGKPAGNNAGGNPATGKAAGVLAVTAAAAAAAAITKITRKKSR